MERYEKKVTLTKNVYDKLIKDKETFQLKKLTKNEFLTRIVINTMSFQKNRDKIDHIIDILSNRNNQLKNNSILNLISANLNTQLSKNELTDIALKIFELDNHISDKKEETISFNIFENKSITGELRNIVENHPSITATHILSIIFNTYLSFPLYIREKIMFQKNYKILDECKKSNLVCKIVTKNNKEIYFEYYDAITSDEEQHLYIIGNQLENNTKKLRSYKLSTIEKVFITNKTYSLNLPLNVQKAIKEYPSWCGDYLNVIIKLDKKGKEKYNTVLNNRPKFIRKIEESDDILTLEFFATSGHLFSYFVSFGRHFEIISNNKESIKLKDSFNKFYTHAYEKIKAE